MFDVCEENMEDLQSVLETEPGRRVFHWLVYEACDIEERSVHLSASIDHLHVLGPCEIVHSPTHHTLRVARSIQVLHREVLRLLGEGHWVIQSDLPWTDTVVV